MSSNLRVSAWNSCRSGGPAIEEKKMKIGKIEQWFGCELCFIRFDIGHWMCWHASVGVIRNLTVS